MKILIVNSAPHTREFIDPILELLNNAATNYEIVNFDNIPLELNVYDGVIITATPKGNDIVDIHLPYFEFIKNTTIPILGICHGHQIIGVLNGSKLIRNKESEDGISTIDILADDPIFDGFSKRFEVEQHHNKSISLPKDFLLLAGSKKCKIQVIKHKIKLIYSVQFHAERSPLIIHNFLNIIKGDA